MYWERIDAYVQRADSGHQISASKAADGWRFSAWAPPQSGRGNARPPGLIGIFDSAEDARAACARDLEAQCGAL